MPPPLSTSLAESHRYGVLIPALAVLGYGFQSLDISFESAIHRQLEKDSIRCATIVLRHLLSPSRISNFRSNVAEQRQNRTYLINPILPSFLPSFPPRLTIVRRVVWQGPCNLLDYDPYEIGLWLPANLDVVFAGVDEDDIHVECWEEAIERHNVACKGRPLLEREGVQMGKYAPERHFDGDLWTVGTPS
jgi:hypothetical protein